MPNIRKNVRDRTVEVLSDPATGFNAQLAAVASEYGITPFEINWTLPSDNFLIGFLDPETVEVSELIKFPGVVLYGGSSVDEKKIKFKTFSGQVLIAVDFYLRNRRLTDIQHPGNDFVNDLDMESIADATEDAFLAAITAGYALFKNNSNGLQLTRQDFQAERDSVTKFGDGQGQRVRFTLGFGASI